MDRTQKPIFDAFQYLLEFPTGRNAKRIVLPLELELTYHERQSITLKINELGGEVISEEHMCSATHIVGSGLYSYSPTLLEALVRGLWIVNIFYITDSYEQLKWLDELQYEVKLETDFMGCAARRNRELALVRRSPNLSSWKIGLLTDNCDPVSKSVFTRLLEAGGAKYFHISRRTDIFTLVYEVDWVLVCGRSVNCEEMVNCLSQQGILCIRLGFLIDTLLMRCPEPMTRYILHTNDISCQQQNIEFNLVMYGYSKKRKNTFLDQDNSNRKREKLSDKRRCRIYNPAFCENQDDFLELDDESAICNSTYNCSSHLQSDSSHSFLEYERDVLQSVTAYPECGYMQEYNQNRVESHENLRTYLFNNCSTSVKRKMSGSLPQELGDMVHCELNMEETSQLEELDDVDFSPVEDSPDEMEILENCIYDKSTINLDEVHDRQSSAKPSRCSDANVVDTDGFASQDVMLQADASEVEVTDCADLYEIKASKKSCVPTQEENTALYSKGIIDRSSFSNESYGTHFRPDTIKRHNPSMDEESGFHSLAEEEKVDDVLAKEHSVNLQFVDGKCGEVQKEICCEVSDLASDVSQLLMGGSNCASTLSENCCSGNNPSKESQCTDINSSQMDYVNDKYCFSDCVKSKTEVRCGNEMCGFQCVKLKVKKNSAPHWNRPRKLYKMTLQEIRKLVKAHIEADLDEPWLSIGVPGPPKCCEGVPARVQMFSVPASNILKSMLNRGLWFGAFNFFDMAVDIGMLPDAHTIQMIFDLILDAHDDDVLTRTRCSIDRLFRKYPPCSLHFNVYYKKVLASKPEDDVLHPGGMVATLLDLLEDELSDTPEKEQIFAPNSKSKKQKYVDLPKSKRFQRIFMLLDCITDVLASDLGRWMQQHYLSVDRALWPERPLAESALRQWGTGIPTKSDIKLLFRVCLQLGDPGKLSYCKSDSLLKLMHIAAEVFRIGEDNPKMQYPHFGAECEFFADQLFLQMEEYGLDSETISKFLDSVTPPWVAMLVGKKLIEKQLGESLRHPLLSIAAVLKERLKHMKERNGDKVNKQSQKIVKEILPRKQDFTKDASAGESRLHTACARGNVNEVHHILSTSCVDVNEYDSSGNTALSIAVQHGHKKCVSVLLKFKPLNGSQRVNASMPGDCGDPPILAAASSGRTDICDMLLEHSGPILLECVTHHQLKTVLKAVPEDIRIILQDPWKFYGHVVPPICRPLSPELWSVLSPILPVLTKSYLHAYNFIAIFCDHNVQRKVRRNSGTPTPRTIGQNVAHGYRMMSYQFNSLLRILKRIEKCKDVNFNVDAYESITIMNAKLQG
ncbi:uncharacterized protein LOC126203420 isoform X2 [Schistocerca nitens]|uniref:uncharacterized protein LOC126203420 isoform X2 n=1 Tax=Schistocerca nitens TaxID=7011 RepID=UPI0021187DF5|nr:uncharacterized protein LOC126203420 isoform X2 [Schistocerca nitens]